MDLLNLCQQILHDMWARKLRSLLALFGIIWGTAAVILLISIGHAFIAANQNKIMNMANGTLIINAGSTSKPYRGFPVDHPVSFKANTIMRLQNVIPHINRLTVDMTGNSDMRHSNQHRRTNIHAVGRDYIPIFKTALIQGSRNFVPSDINDARNVIVLGSSIKQQLFGAKPAIGQHILVHGAIQFLVIGVMTPQTSNTELNSSALMPYTTYINIWSNRNISFFVVQPQKGYGVYVKNSIRSYLGNRFHFKPNDNQALQIFDTTAFSDFFKWFFMAIQVFLGLCGALTLGVGGMGVANIMFLIVTERTREIGLRMAVGAQDWQVMMQIILEAVIIVGVGGLIGFFISLFLVSLLQLSNLPSWMGHPSMSWLAVFATIIILVPTAILSGYFPGRNAARLDPVDALRK